MADAQASLLIYAALHVMDLCCCFDQSKYSSLLGSRGETKLSIVLEPFLMA